MDSNSLADSIEAELRARLRGNMERAIARLKAEITQRAPERKKGAKKGRAPGTMKRGIKSKVWETESEIKGVVRIPFPAYFVEHGHKSRMRSPLNKGMTIARRLKNGSDFVPAHEFVQPVIDSARGWVTEELEK